MKKNLLMTAAMTAVLLTGCSSDEEIANIETSAKNAIGFNIVSNKAETKATPIGPDNLTSTDFDVFAFNSTTGDLFMGDHQATLGHDGVNIHYDKVNTKWDYKNPADLAYWPSDGSKLNFYAISPATLEDEEHNANYLWLIHGPKAITGTDGTEKVTNEIYCSLVNEYGNSKGGKNYDLMYATAFNYDKGTYGTKVKLTFKHTLSQVIFKGKTSNASLKADIKSITMKNIIHSGYFSIPAELQTEGDNYARDPKASDWTLTTSRLSFAAKLTAENIILDSNTEAKDLSKADEPILVIPQVLTPWPTTPENAVSIDTGTTNGQSYLEIVMKLTQNEQYVIGTASEYQTIYVPFANVDDNNTTGWEPGKRYIYTLTFGGGYDKDGNLILAPITFEPSVDDWLDASGYNIQVK